MRFLLLLSCVMFSYGANIEEIQPQDIVLDVKGSLVDFNTDNVKFIGKVIDRNIKIFDELIVKINQSEDYEKVFPVIVTSVDKLAKNYRTIANKKESIRKTLDRQVKEIEDQRIVSAEKIKFINQKIKQTEREIAKETVDYRISAFKSTLRFQEQERDVWIKFNRGMQFTDLISKLRDASGGINKFIDILDVNAGVYEQASITLNTIQSYKKATKDLQEVMSVVDLGNDLVDSWNKLAIVIDGAMEHIETIETLDFDNLEPAKTEVPINKEAPKTIILE